jgi:hypothetical protein
MLARAAAPPAVMAGRLPSGGEHTPHPHHPRHLHHPPPSPPLLAVIEKKKFRLSPSFRTQQLYTEASLLTSLTHPHIVACVDVFDNDAELTIVMEHAHGGTQRGKGW